MASKLSTCLLNFFLVLSDYEKNKLYIFFRLVTLKKYLAKFGIRRNDRTVAPIRISNAIEEERQGPGLNGGYRFMHRALRNRHGLFVSR